MTELFLRAVNAGVAAGWLVLAVLALRLLLRKAPRWSHVLLWGLVALRLVFPFFPESPWSLLPSAQAVPRTVLDGHDFQLHTGLPGVDGPVNRAMGDYDLADFALPLGDGLDPVTALSLVWVAGAALLLCRAAVGYLRLRRRVRTAVLLRGGIFQSEHVSSPFLLGLIKPRIYLPFGLDGETLEHVVAHERAHIRRRDHWWKPLGFLLLALHWFHPLMWLAYALLCRDMELACDEAVIQGLEKDQRADYSQALLACSVRRGSVAACPLAFGEVGVKARVKSVLGYKPPARALVALAVLVLGVTALCFLTDPPGGGQGDARVEGGYYLLMGADGVTEVHISTPHSGGICRNTGGVPFERGEELYLEPLTGTTDLRGVSITAVNGEGDTLYAFSVPEEAPVDEIIDLLGRDPWLMAPTASSTNPYP